VASSPLPGGPRHVGRVIDPSVREDGEREPSLELATEPPRVATPDAPGPELEDASPLVRGTLLRERLLERAAQADRAPDYDDDGAFADLDQIGRDDQARVSEPEVASGPTRAPSAPIALNRRGRLSPNQIALFMTLLGVATVASLIALASNLDSSVRARLPLAPSASAVSAPPAVAPSVPRESPARPKRARQKLPGPWRIEDAKNDAKTRVVDGQVKSDAFLTALEKAGIEQRERYRILTSMKGVRDFDRCKKTDRFRVLLERGGARVRAFEYIAGAGEVYQSREGDDGLLKGTKLDLKLAQNQVTGALVYDGSGFDASAERSGFDPGLRKVVAKALDGHMDMNELERGDRLRLVAQETTVLGEFGSYSGVEAIEVRSADGGRALRVYYFDHGAERGYYDAEGRAPYEGGWRKPVKDAAMTSPFNMKRLHPILKKVVPHLGIDFAAPVGTPVGASSFGTVSFIGYAGPAGNLVKVEHANNIETGYAHLSRFAEGLKVGDKVKRLQLVGYVGSTGRSTGPHLHFSASRNDS
jgi:murein DD-endopeptidase MepM/ murein hydrolase activator NlpD